MESFKSQFVINLITTLVFLCQYCCKYSGNKNWIDNVGGVGGAGVVAAVSVYQVLSSGQWSLQRYAALTAEHSHFVNSFTSAHLSVIINILNTCPHTFHLLKRIFIVKL